MEGATTLGAAAPFDYSNDIAEIPSVTSSDETVTYTIDTPTVKVKVPPPPAPAPVATSTSSGATTVSKSTSVQPSASVQAAIAGSAVIAEAAKYVGVPYVSGGSTPAGFDCSGFVSYVYGQLGVSLPRSSSAYWSLGTRVSSPQPGDLILTSGHIGIYAGKNLQIDAPRPGKTIQFRAIWQSNPVYVRVT
ncbi:C40 family peptidase [Demequina sp.]|uniref:C40 family peptidase n=1 Tax=Demequina sp. TaxID=2050685 RepID=UPI0025D40522|nr:C40 family peptidase [Demequina sp.]